jgi:hypothetical protein
MQIFSQNYISGLEAVFIFAGAEVRSLPAQGCAHNLAAMEVYCPYSEEGNSTLQPV